MDAFCKGACTGENGDDKIFISELVECIRIRTRERGNKTMG
nr:P-II family nitrogen regulator [Marispirochaeta sp.]